MIVILAVASGLVIGAAVFVSAHRRGRAWTAVGGGAAVIVMIVGLAGIVAAVSSSVLSQPIRDFIPWYLVGAAPPIVILGFEGLICPKHLTPGSWRVRMAAGKPVAEEAPQ